MVVIEPFDFLFGEQLFDDRPGIDRAKRDGLKIIEGAKFFGLLILLCDNQVLDTDTILIGTINPRFIGSDHSRFELGRIFFHTNALRPFVYIEEVSDAVAGSMPIGKFILPQIFSGKYIELRSACSFGEDGGSKGNMSFQHQCIIFFHLSAQLADSHRTGDIGGAVLILGSRVYQHYSFGLYLQAGFRRGVVMNNGSVPGIAGNRSETLSHKEILL